MMTETKVPSRFRRGLTRVLATIGGFSVAVLLLLVLVPLIFFRGTPVPGRVIIELDLTPGLVESVPEDPVGAIIGRNEMTIRDAVEALKRAESDDRVRGLVARVGSANLSMPQVEELREAVASFRATGKPTIAFAETFGEFGSGRGDYYLATAFEEIHLQPSGDVGLTGLIAEMPFVAQTLELVGVEPEMGHRYEYKDAVNVFTEEEMTDPQREATERVLTSMYENLVAGIAAGRELSAAEVRRLIDTGPHYGQEALQAGLVDRLSYRDEVYDSLRVRVGGGEYLYAQRYLAGAGRPHDQGPQIALIFGTGAVQTGSSQVNPLAGGTVMGSETVTRAFRAASESEQVRAILFRVDSPGGSYVASDAIWRETMRARQAGKPVIVSMGSVAGSGGYFVAMGADRIVAQPSTITGSIGVYAGKMVVEELSSKLGITWDNVQVGGNATTWSLVEGYSPEERARLEAGLDRVYEDFTAKAAAGRGLSRDSVHALARGRIWTGADAMRFGLVDELGGMSTALRLAKEAAGIDPGQEVTLRVFPRERSLLEMLFEPASSSSYPATFAGVVTLIDLVERLVAQLAATGLLGPRGSLTMPGIPQIR
jgi:protease-4